MQPVDSDKLPVDSTSNVVSLVSALNERAHTDSAMAEVDMYSIAQEPSDTFFGFSIASKNILIAATVYCEVVVSMEICAIPNAAECFLGLINHRGDLIPVYQLHSVYECAIPKKKIVLIIDKWPAAVGLLVDELPVSLRLKKTEKQLELSQEINIFSELLESSYFSSGKHYYLICGEAVGEYLLKCNKQKATVYSIK